MKDEEGKVIEVAPHPQQIVRFKVDRAVRPLGYGETRSKNRKRGE